MWGKTVHLPEHGFNQVSNSLAGTWYFQSVPQFSVCMMYLLQVTSYYTASYES